MSNQMNRNVLNAIFNLDKSKATQQKI